MSDIAIRVENLCKRYRIGLKEEIHDTMAGALADFAKRPIQNLRRLRRLTRFSESGQVPTDDVIWALKDVSFEVKRGEVVGIIGRNGAGKSTLLKVLSRITHPTSGRVELNGRISSLLEVGTGFHPELTGRENIYLNGTILGMRKAEIDGRFDEIVEFSGVEKFIDTPVKRYSSGMRVRLAFSVAAHLEPEILLIDEVLAVGDVEFQKKCLGKMSEVADGGRTVLFVSHNMGAVVELCDSCLLINDGHLEAIGETRGIVRVYQDSFNKGLNSDDTRKHGSVWFGDISVGLNGDNTIDAGEQLEFRTVLCSKFGAADVRLFCIVKNAKDEEMVIGVQETRDIDAFDDCAVEFKIAVIVPPLWLSPGIYTVFFKAWMRGNTFTQSGRYLSERTPFTVAGKSNPERALLYPPVSWSIVAEV